MTTAFPKRGRGATTTRDEADASFVDLDGPPKIPAAKEKRSHSPFAYLRIRKRSTEGPNLKKQSSREDLVLTRTQPPPVPPIPVHTRNFSEPVSPSEGVATYTYPLPQAYSYAKPPQPRANSGSDSSLSSLHPQTPPRPPILSLPYVASPASSQEDINQTRLAAAHAFLPAPSQALTVASVSSAAASEYSARHRNPIAAGSAMHASTSAHRGHGGLPGLAQTLVMDKAKLAASVGPLITNGMQNLTKAQTVIDDITSSEAWSVVKESAETVLAPAKDVVVILDSVVKYVPAIMVAESIFSVIIKHELERSENDKNILVVYHTMSVFWFTLCDLQAIFRADQDHIKLSLGTFFQDVGKTIEDFGNFREVYYRHGHFARTLRSSEYRTKLTGFTTAFAQHKSDLHFILSESSALEIHDAVGTVGNMASQLNVVTKQLALVTKMLSQPTALEVRVEAAVKEGGDGALQASATFRSFHVIG
ncbi:hypothetical protein HMN09_00811400 [Mycena chlorophos]|uniref:Uncharacterized protein n=1 Tax=Mycena chlorophos TaxID=658473 RepID=A0A8H6W5G2_MYCCL|nr:hypothetical protein HMN09_00811400 [Mycena chlorophos]